MNKGSFLFFFTLLVGTVSAQAVLENNPPSLKWSQVNTPHFSVLFPNGLETQAQRMANTLEVLYKPGAQTLGSSPRKIYTVLQTRSSQSNAFVSITPRRAEFYTMPSQNYNFIGNNDWLNQLAAHEYRHVVQYQHSKQGLNKFLFYLFGSNTLSVVANLSAPQWFWEGDAVATETALLPTGRGSIPNFGLEFRTNLLEGRTFNYQKQYLTSFKHFIPNHYVLGYHMVSYLRKRTGDPMIWGKITSRAWSKSLFPFTFSNAIKKETGLYVTDLYKEMTADLQKTWKQSIDTLTLTAFERIDVQRDKAYTDYSYPQVLQNGHVLALKNGIGDIDRLVTLDGNKERKVFVPGILNRTGMLSSAANKIVWNEFRYHPRWRVVNYSVVKVYDFNTRKTRTIASTRSRYAGAALSPDATKVVTVQSDIHYRHSLVILDLNKNQVLKEFPNPENYFYSMPRWSDDGKYIVALRTTPAGKAVTLVDVETGTFEDIIPPGDENIGNPVLYGKFLFYNSPVSGIDNIYALDRSSGQTYRVTNSRYGAYNPFIAADRNELYYNEQSRDGLDVVWVPFDPVSWKLVTKEKSHDVSELDDVLISQEGEKQNLLENVPQQQYPVTKYSKLKGLLNPYSWGAYFENTLAQADIGISSQDILSTTSLSAGYRYDIFENSGSWYGSLSYQGFFPILDVTVLYGNREEDRRAYGEDVNFKWTETGITAGVRVPLLLTRSKYLTELSISNDVGFILTSGFESTATPGGLVVVGSDRYIKIGETTEGMGIYYVFSDRTDFGQLIYNNFNISWGHYFKQSHRDLLPKFGQFVSFENYMTPFGGDYQGWLWAARGSLYFPGLLKHHSAYLRGGYQQSYSSPQLDTYSFRNLLFKPRGYGYPRHEKFYTVSANYAFPIWYPDINIGPLLNIQRIKGNLFYDFGEGQGVEWIVANLSNIIFNAQDIGATYSSFGAEVTVDFNLFRLQPRFEAGLRVSRISANSFYNAGFVYELLIGNITF